MADVIGGCLFSNLWSLGWGSPGDMDMPISVLHVARLALLLQ